MKKLIILILLVLSNVAMAKTEDKLGALENQLAKKYPCAEVKDINRRLAVFISYQKRHNLREGFNYEEMEQFFKVSMMHNEACLFGGKSLVEPWDKSNEQTIAI